MRPAKSINAAIMPPTMPPTGSLDVDEPTSESAVDEDEGEENEGEEDEGKEYDEGDAGNRVPIGGRMVSELILLEPYTMEFKMNQVWFSVEVMSNE